MSNYTIMNGIKSQNEDTLKEQFALDILTGFSSEPKFINSKYFYDDIGSDLFSKITETDDYYPTRCEFEILNKYKSQITEELGGEDIYLIELGAGDGRKTVVLLEEFGQRDERFHYIPVDISEGAVKGLEEKISKNHPNVTFHGIVGEYGESLKWIGNEYKGRRKVILFLGSNLGNFNKAQARVFLRRIWKSLDHGDTMLIGFDLKKDIDTMLWAYNDRDKVTRNFNLNVLSRINKELGADFDVKNFQHYGTYNPQLGSMESYLISMKKQSVYINELEKSFDFKAFEPIHMEYSYKYLLSDIDILAEETGFTVEKNFCDDKNYFVDSVWKVIKEKDVNTTY